jgi:hypothetical protein
MTLSERERLERIERNRTKWLQELRSMAHVEVRL